MRLLKACIALSFSLFAFSGCQKKNDACDNVTCFNGGTCSDGKCACPEGWEGANCNATWAQKFIGFTDAEYVGASASSSYVAIVPVPTNLTVFTISNFLGTGANDKLICERTGEKTFKFRDNQTVGTHFIGSGSGFLDADGLKINGTAQTLLFGTSEATIGFHITP